MIKDSATHASHELVKLPVEVNLKLNELSLLSDMNSSMLLKLLAVLENATLIY